MSCLSPEEQEMLSSLARKFGPGDLVRLRLYPEHEFRVLSRHEHGRAWGGSGSGAFNLPRGAVALRYVGDPGLWLERWPWEWADAIERVVTP